MEDTHSGASNDSEMPTLGLGTWQNDDPDACAESIRIALETGYRHVDTAQAYGNEAAVGRGIADADVDRDEIFLATKLWTDSLAHDDVIESTRESLDRLGTEYLDLLYVHWPAGDYDPESTLPAFDRLHEEGTIDRIGVSNFEPDHIETARSVLDAPIFANQVEVHPLLQQQRLRTFCADADIEVVAYSPLARGEVFDVDVLSEIAAEHGVSEAQVSLAWLRANGITAIPKATSADHLRDNWASLDLTLTDSEIERIDAIDAERRLVDPGFAPSSW
jgi:diketogulonate reductase-like aldo/keto reductase